MIEHDRKMMEIAVDLARTCQIEEAKLKETPRVGAVINIGGEEFHGQRGENDHAEKNALANVEKAGASGRLRGATVYTTLEPCTKHVRRKPRESCTERLIEAKVKKVFVGILDPNQGVCGKGVLELQEHDIEVALFPHDLAEKIRILNSEFIRAQQSLGIEFVFPKPNDEVHSYKTDGKVTIRCSCTNPPDASVRIFIRKSGLWWPQPASLRQVGDSEIWEATIHFGDHGHHEIHVVKVNDLGNNLINFYTKIITENMDRKRRLIEKGSSDEQLKVLGHIYPGIDLPAPLPKGLDTEAFVEVDVVRKTP